jgi:hypothetical protein
MNQDEQHLKLLSIFHYVLGGLTALFSCFPLLHIAMGIAMLCGAFDDEDGPPKIFAVFFIVLPAMFILCGWALAVCIIIAGRKLARHKARLYCLVIAGLECIMMPFGTVLGVFTIIVLTKDSVKKLFSPDQGLQPPS